MKTVVGYYNTVAKATQVKGALTTEGFNDVTVIDQSNESYSTGHEGTNAEHNTVGGKIKHFFSGLTGDDDTSHEHYSRGVSGGGAVVAVNVSDERAEAAADLLEQYGATNVEGDEGSNYGSTGTYGSTGSALGAGTGSGVYDAGDRNFGTGTGTVFGGNNGPVATSAVDTGITGTTGTSTGSGLSGDVEGYGDTNRGTVAGEQVIPVVEEELVVGKRQVQRGGVRIFSRVVSEPVSENVSLHDERVVVDRRVVDRPATEADFAPETRAVEVTAMGEEAVVGKASRVVEEIVVGKEATDRVQEVGDTVRHTEVDVEPVTTETTTTGVTTGTTGSKY